MWTNSCCSHPQYKQDELDQHNDKGIKKAAIKRVKFELGLDIEDISDLHLIDKVLYRSKSCDKWGEYELDYTLFVKIELDKTKEIPYNKDEIQNVRWVAQNQMLNFVHKRQNQYQQLFTPWFYGILRHNLLLNWNLFSQNQLDIIEYHQNMKKIFHLDE